MGLIQIIDRQFPHRHRGHVDTINGSYGRFGIIRMQQFYAAGVLHQGVGIHSGRSSRGGADHPTMGCIRTTDGAMQAITQHMRTDPLTSITVQSNHDQVNRLGPHHKGDHQHHQHKADPGTILI